MSLLEKNIYHLEKIKRIEIDDENGLLSETKLNIRDIGLYGVRYQLKQFAEIDINIILNKCTIEHGLSPWKYVCQMEVQHHVSRILTYSPYREDVIRELTELTPEAIGPYIAYAEEYCEKKFLEEKKRKCGRVLLVMPIHSISGIEAVYSVENFCQEIERLKSGFDMVMVCLYIEDLRRGLGKLYREKGYKVVSAGQQYSPYFFSRLKYILSLSDALVLNEYSTGMAYAMYMGKPIHLTRGVIQYNTTCNNNSYQLERNPTEDIYDLFDNEQFLITNEQIKFGKYMFGIDCLKSKEEMRKLLLSLTRSAE